MSTPTHLKSLQALELALRTGSLKAAADELGISPAAAGQRVKALEDYLGADLVVRARAGLQPSPALAAALPHLTAAFRELELVGQALDLQKPQDIHIATASDFAELWLASRLARFRRAHPKIRFCINGEGEAPLRLGAVDCEITFGAPPPGADALFPDFVLPVASPQNKARLEGLEDKARLEGFPLLHLDFYKDDPAVPDWGRWIRTQALEREAPDRGIRFQRIARALEAVRASAGVALCGAALIHEEIAAGTIATPLPRVTGTWTSGTFNARFRPEALARPQVRRFRDWLLAESAGTLAWLEAYAG